MVPMLSLDAATPLLAPDAARPTVNSSEEIYYKWPFQNPNLTAETRVEDLISRLTLDEKVSLMFQYMGAIIRLGIPSMRTGTEGLHGVSWIGYATVFPEGAGIAATWNKKLNEQVGDVVGKEIRAYNSVNSHFYGIDMWSPVVDLSRDPRAGRAAEHMGEDPFLTGQMATHYGLGMKGMDNQFYYMSIPTLKHFVANDHENNRVADSSNLSPRNMYEYYLPSFSDPIKAGGVNGVMSSYNLLNGKPMMVHPVMRNEFFPDWVPGGFEHGSILNVTDEGNPGNMYGSDHRYFLDIPYGRAASAGATFANTGQVLTQNKATSINSRHMIYEALARGLTTEEDIDKTIHPILLVRCHAGDLDADRSLNPYKEINKQNAGLPDPALVGDVDALKALPNSKVARKVAQEQVVLLKNEGGILPLSKSIPKVALSGPLTTEVSAEFYSGAFPYVTIVKDEFAKKLQNPATQLMYSRGVDTVAFKSLASGTLSGANGKYLAAAANPSNAVTVTGTDRNDPRAQFLHMEYAHGSSQLKSVAHEDLVNNTGYLMFNLRTNNRASSFNGPDSMQWYWGQQSLTVWRASSTPASGATVPADGLEPAKTPNVRIAFNAVNNYTVSRSSNSNNILVTNGTTGAVNNNGTSSSANSASLFDMEIVKDGKADAAADASAANVAVVCVGTQAATDSREAMDRPSTATNGDAPIALAKGQLDLVNAVAAANPNTVVVVVSSIALDISSIKANPNVKGIILSSQAGQELGTAVADVLFGDYAPSGRMHTTWYAGIGSLPGIKDYDIIKGGRTYMYHTADDVIYPFGHGLTYADFEYVDMSLANTSAVNTDKTKSLAVTATIKNNSAIASDEVVQVYVKYKDPAQSKVINRPIKVLKGFDRVHFGAQEQKTVTIPLSVEDLAIWDVNSDGFYVEPGVYSIMLGKSSDNIVKTVDVTITGNPIAPRSLDGKIDPMDWDDYSFTGTSADIVPTSVMEDDTFGINIVKNNSWVQYRNVKFAKDAGGKAYVTMRASNSGSSASTVEIRKGGRDGDLLGTITIPSTGHIQTYTNVIAQVDSSDEVGELSFVFPNSGINVKWFAFSPSKKPAATSGDIKVNALTYANVTTVSDTNTTNTLARLHLQTEPVLTFVNSTLLVEALIDKVCYVDANRVAWALTDTDGNATTLATITANGAVRAAGVGSGVVRATATYMVDGAPVSNYIDIEVKNLARGENGIEAIGFRSGGEASMSDNATNPAIGWGMSTEAKGTSNQYTNFGSIYQYKGSLLVSAITYPNDQATARKLKFTIKNEDPTQSKPLATVDDGVAGFVEGLGVIGDTSNAARAFNATVTATGAGNGWVVLTATHEPTGITASRRLYIDNQAARNAYETRYEAELFDDGSYRAIRGKGVRPENVHGNDVGMQLNGFHDGDHVVYKNFDFGANVNNLEMTFRYVKYLASDATIDVYLDSMDSANQIGTFTVQGDGDNQIYNWKDVTIQLNSDAPINGVHDVYLKFTGEKVNDNEDFFDLYKYEYVSGLRDFGINWFSIEATAKYNFTVATGQTITIPITAENCRKLSGLRGTIEYDDSLLTLNSISAKNGWILAREGTTFVALTNDGAGVDGTAVIGYVIFTAKADLSDDILTEVKFPLGKINAYDDTLASTPVGIAMINILIEGIPPMRGDVNLDGNVDLIDAILLMQYLSGNVDLSAKQLKAADVNADKSVNVGDVIIIMQMCL